jgi:hypothetical protein
MVFFAVVACVASSRMAIGAALRLSLDAEEREHEQALATFTSKRAEAA